MLGGKDGLMSELPLRNNCNTPINEDFLYDLGEPAIFSHWLGGSQPVKSIFYSYNYEQHNYRSADNVSLRAIQPNPDTLLANSISGQYTTVAMHENLPMESAPPAVHSTYLVVIASLYSIVTLIDPREPCKPCTVVDGGGGNSTGCQPLADMEMLAAPVALLEVDAAPIAGLDQEDIPSASLTCKIIS